MIPDERSERIDRAKFLLKKSGLDALLISGEANILYLTGFSGKDSFLVLNANGDNFFLADSRIYDEAKAKVDCANMLRITKMASSFSLMADTLVRSKIRKLGFESQYVTYFLHKKLAHVFNKMKLLPTEGVIEQLRAVKSRNELSSIKKSSSVTKKIFQKIQKLVHPGVSETEIAKEIDIMIKMSGGSSSFDTIVATGKHSSWPHATPSKRKLGSNDIMLMDFGARIAQYCSDFTRVIFTGAAKKRFDMMHEVVAKAQNKALESMKPGLIIDSVVRRVNRIIEEAGFGKFILHGLGHGIGLEIHELPWLSAKSNFPIKKNMVFTIEPGIYVPGVGGVRIEDTVYMGDDGPEVLTR
ncbi:MAG: hypothetical protein A2Z72_02480 [Omnitrophica bacterium RBG_13_46_9]|nr:MAG: hypothetical protein A2Z72_02480 [Omnitrophica bacterium RBG_13_46_9]